jgi:hypothetical protein
MMLYKTLMILVFTTILSVNSFSQSVGIGTNTPDPAAALDVQSGPIPQGMYIPRLTATERIGMTLNASNIGLLVYDTDSLNIMHWTGTQWSKLGGNNTNPITQTVTEYLTIPAASFISYDTEADTYVAQKNSDGGILYLKGTSETFAGAGVHLPDGAILNTITLYSKDLIASGDNITAELYQMNPSASSTPALIGSITSNDATVGDFAHQNSISSTIDNANFFYWLQLRANGAQGSTQNLGTYGVKITYTIVKVQ